MTNHLSCRQRSSGVTARVKGQSGTKRDIAELRISDDDNFEYMVNCLNRNGWIFHLLVRGSKLSTKDLLPIRNPRNYDSIQEISMLGLARNLDSIVRTEAQRAKSQKANMWKEVEEDCCLALDLGEAATQCSDMKTFVCISFYLFRISAKVWGAKITDGSEVREIAHKYLSSYVALVLLGESIALSVGAGNSKAAN